MTTMVFPAVNNDTDWIERPAIPELGFKLWHVMFMAFSAFLSVVILVCCCVKIRIPRTKQEIEADYQRKKIARKFRQRLRLIQNQDMDNLDLKTALERVRQDFHSENIDTISQIESIHSVQGTMKAEPQQPVNKGFGQRLANVLAFTKKTTKEENEKLNQI